MSNELSKDTPQHETDAGSAEATPATENKDQFKLFEETGSVPHAGTLPAHAGQELPVREFDQTPLSQAVQEGYIKTPESPAGLTDAKKRKVSTRAKVGSALVAALALGGGVLGISRAAEEESPKSAPVTSTKTEDTEKAKNKTLTNPEYAVATEAAPSDKDINIIFENLQEYFRTGEEDFLIAALGDNAPVTVLGDNYKRLKDDLQQYFDTHYGTSKVYRREVTIIDRDLADPTKATITIEQQQADLVATTRADVDFEAVLSAKNNQKNWVIATNTNLVDVSKSYNTPN